MDRKKVVGGDEAAFEYRWGSRAEKELTKRQVLQFVSEVRLDYFLFIVVELILEGFSRDPSFDQNTVRDSGNINGIRDSTATREAGFTKTRTTEQNIIRESDEAGCGISPPLKVSNSGSLFHSNIFNNPRSIYFDNSNMTPSG